MGQLLAFLIKYRAFLLFLVLETFCIWLIVQNNDYQRSAFINSSSKFVGSVNETSRDIGDYFRLRRVNDELAAENARLRELLFSGTEEIPIDSLVKLTIDKDTTDSIQYILKPAEITRNSVQLVNNFFMINKGSKDGIEPGMGVMNSFGVVGTIRSVSKNVAEGISILNTRNSVSALHLKSDRVGTVQWDGRNPKRAALLYITPDVELAKGDSIVTSSFNAVFPKEVLIGTVDEVSRDEQNTYLQIMINLSVDFAKLSYVYVIKNELKIEQDSLMNSNPLDIQ